MNELQHFPFLSLFSAISPHFCSGSCTFNTLKLHSPSFHSVFTSALSHFSPFLSCLLSSGLGAPPLPTLRCSSNPPFLSKVSPSLSFYSLLLCCIPVPVVKRVDKEEGGKKRKGELELWRGRERGKGGRRAPFFMRMPTAGSAERRTPA